MALHLVSGRGVHVMFWSTPIPSWFVGVRVRRRTQTERPGKAGNLKEAYFQGSLLSQRKISAEDFGAWIMEGEKWANATADLLEHNLGPGARLLFLFGRSHQPGCRYTWAINENHQAALGNINGWCDVSESLIENT